MKYKILKDSFFGVELLALMEKIKKANEKAVLICKELEALAGRQLT